jgi:outer membrane protein assembly factor BamA
MDIENDIRVTIEDDANLQNIVHKLNIPLKYEYSNIDEFSIALPIIWTLIENTSMFTPEYAELLPSIDRTSKSVTARLKIVPKTTSYSLGAAVNKRGSPSVDFTICYPSFAYKPFLLNASLSRSWEGSRLFSSDLTFPRVFGGRTALKFRAFSTLSDFSVSNSYTERSMGASASLSKDRHSLELVAALRGISISKSDQFKRMDNLEHGQLTSQRTSLKYSYSFDKLKFLRASPTIPVRGISAQSVVDIPLPAGDSQCVRMTGLFSIYHRTFASVVTKLSLRSGLVFNVPGNQSSAHLPVVSPSSSPRNRPRDAPEIPVMDRFFLGGVTDATTSFPGFGDRSVPLDSDGKSNGALGFLSLGTSINFDIPVLQIPGMRGFAFAQGGIVVSEFRAMRTSLPIRSCIGLGLCVPVGVGNLEATFSIPMNSGDEQVQVFQIGVSSTQH